MRRLLWVAVAVVLVLGLTGCIDVVEHVTVNSDGSADIERTIMIDSQVLDSLAESGGSTEDPLESASTSLTAEGWTVTSVEESSSQGIKATIHVDDSTQMASVLGTEYAGGVTIQPGLLESTYNVDMTIDNSDGASTSEEQDFSDFMTMKFKLTLPGEMGTHNGTISADDPNTIEWDIANSGTTQITASSKATGFAGGVAVLAGIGGGCCLLLIIVVVVIVVLLRGRKKKAAAAAQAAAPAPYAPPAPAPYAPAPEPAPAPVPYAPAPEPAPAPAPEPEPPA